MVVHIISSLNVGGAEMMLKKLLLARKQNGINDIVICLTSKGKIGDDLSKRNIEVYYLNMRLFTLPIAVFTLFKLIKNLKPKLLQTWLYHSDFFGGLVSVLYKIPVVWNIRQTHFSTKFSFTYLLMKLCARLSFFIPNYIICAANNSKASHIKYGYDEKKMLVIPNGFNIEKTLLPSNVDVNSCKKDKSDILIGIIGRYHADKDYPTFIKASSFVLNLYPNAKFLMVGKNLTSDNIELVKLIKKYSDINKFYLHGESDQVDLIFPVLDVFVLSSLNEGFPNVLGEAMMFGIPCVSTDAGDASLIIGNTGRITPIGNSNELGKAICEILSLNDDEKKYLSDSAKLRIKNKYSLASTVSKYSDLYDNLAKS